MFESFGAAFDDDEAELGVVDDDAGEVVLRGVVADLGLVRRVGEVADPVKVLPSIPGDTIVKGRRAHL